MDKGGRLCIVDYNKDAPDGPPAQIRVPPEQVIQEMNNAGWVQIQKEKTDELDKITSPLFFTRLFTPKTSL